MRKMISHCFRWWS